jgi:D-tyrosyl-tRNA(Tyr) deacylase
MRAVIERVSSCEVRVKGEVVSKINRGLLVLLGFGKEDENLTAEQRQKFCKKLVNLRIFEDEAGKLNYSLLDIRGEIMVVSQFTLYANLEGGRRPSFEQALEKNRAQKLYNEFIEELRTLGVQTASGIFGAKMEVALVNDGPVTLIIEEGEE